MSPNKYILYNIIINIIIIIVLNIIYIRISNKFFLDGWCHAHNEGADDTVSQNRIRGGVPRLQKLI